MQALECLEELAGLFHVESGAVVTDKVDRYPFLIKHTEGYVGYLRFGGVFPGIGQQVFNHDLQQGFIRLHVNRLGEVKDSLAERVFPA